MEEIWTDRDELDRLNEIFDDEQSSLQTTIYQLNQLVPNCKLGNIGLYSGNKIRSLYRRFKENDVDYTFSRVNRAIEMYFIYQYDKALYLLNRFAKKMQKTLGNYVDINTMRKFVLSSPEIEEYKRICEEIYQFDLDNDILTAINYALDETPVLFVMGINEAIDKYNEELKQLKVSQSVEYRNDTISIELPEGLELVILKNIIEDINKKIKEEDYIELEEDKTEFQKIIRKNKKNKE